MSELAMEYPRRASALQASHEILAGVQYSGAEGLGIIATQQEATVSEAKADTETIVLPPTTLEISEVRRLLETRNSSTPDERIMGLLDYAWDSSSIIERPVPSELLPHLPLRPSEWYKQNLRRLELVLKVRGHKTHEERYEAQDIEEETQSFNNAPFIRNAETIRSVSWHSPDGSRVAFAARMMLHEANKLRQKEFRAN